MTFTLISEDQTWTKGKGIPGGEKSKGKGLWYTSQPNLHCNVCSCLSCDHFRGLWCLLPTGSRRKVPFWKSNFCTNLKISICIVGSRLHRNHSHAQPNFFPKWIGSLDCYLGCELLRSACPVGSALALAPPFPIWTILPVSKLPNFNQMTPIMLYFLCSHEKQNSINNLQSVPFLNLC